MCSRAPLLCALVVCGGVHAARAFHSQPLVRKDVPACATQTSYTAIGAARQYYACSADATVAAADVLLPLDGAVFEQQLSLGDDNFDQVRFDSLAADNAQPQFTSFDFFGETCDRVVVCANGFVTLLAPWHKRRDMFECTVIPNFNTGAPYNTIRVLHADWNPEVSGSAVRMAVLPPTVSGGGAPRLVIEWSVPYYSQTDIVWKGQIELRANGDIKLRSLYHNNVTYINYEDSDPQVAGIGVFDANNTAFHAFYVSEPVAHPLPAGDAFVIAYDYVYQPPPPPPTASSTAAATIAATTFAGATTALAATTAAVSDAYVLTNVADDSGGGGGGGSDAGSSSKATSPRPHSEMASVPGSGGTMSTIGTAELANAPPSVGGAGNYGAVSLSRDSSYQELHMTNDAAAYADITLSARAEYQVGELGT